MTRIQTIQSLRRRYASAMTRRAHKAANVISAQLRALITKQLRAEMRASKN